MKQGTLASGRYILDRVIGGGGMADVYCARDTRLGRDVAVKLFRPGSAEGVARGSGEAKILAGLHHPGLVRVLDMDAECYTVEPSYLVMEYVHGPDLAALLREGPLPVERTMTAGRDVARTLDYIHGRGIVHRDIKPSNVLTRAAGTPDHLYDFLLTDFGIARFFQSSRVSATGSLIGTATYFSPEQARGDSVGTPTDIYALGLVLIECLTGQPAFPGTGLESALARLSRPPHIPEDFGRGWCSLLADMTLDDPLARPNAADVVRRLEALKPPASARPSEPTTVQAPASAVLLNPCPQPQEQAPHSTVLEMTEDATVQPRSSGKDYEAIAGEESAARRIRARVMAAVVVLVSVAVLGIVLLTQAAAGPPPSPLPGLPGSTGVLLDNLYESVQQ